MAEPPPPGPCEGCGHQLDTRLTGRHGAASTRIWEGASPGSPAPWGAGCVTDGLPPGRPPPCLWLLNSYLPAKPNTHATFSRTPPQTFTSLLGVTAHSCPIACILPWHSLCLAVYLFEHLVVCVNLVGTPAFFPQPLVQPARGVLDLGWGSGTMRK